jgi:hypothetical protein
MAASKKTRFQTSHAAKAKRRRLIKDYLVGDRSMAVWEIVNDVIRELNTERRVILEEYVRTDGDTDWVWLEENLSFQLDENHEVHANTPEEEHAAYIAAFILAASVIRAEYPKVLPPIWLSEDMADLRNTKIVPPEIGEMARDAFLSGRDQEALEMLTPLEEGPFIFMLKGFFTEIDRLDPGSRNLGARHVAVSLPSGTTFTVQNTFDDHTFHEYDIPSAIEAIGICTQAFVQRPDLTWEVHCIATDSPWHGRVIYAISNDAEAIEIDRNRT